MRALTVRVHIRGLCSAPLTWIQSAFEERRLGAVPEPPGVSACWEGEEGCLRWEKEWNTGKHFGLWGSELLRIDPRLWLPVEGPRLPFSHRRIGPMQGGLEAAGVKAPFPMLVPCKRPHRGGGESRPAPQKPWVQGIRTEPPLLACVLHGASQYECWWWVCVLVPYRRCQSPLCLATPDLSRSAQFPL